MFSETRNAFEIYYLSFLWFLFLRFLFLRFLVLFSSHHSALALAVIERSLKSSAKYL